MSLLLLLPGTTTVPPGDPDPPAPPSTVDIRLPVGGTVNVVYPWGAEQRVNHGGAVSVLNRTGGTVDINVTRFTGTVG